MRYATLRSVLRAACLAATCCFGLHAQSGPYPIPHPATGQPTPYSFDPSIPLAWAVTPAGELLVLTLGQRTGIQGLGAAAMDGQYGAGNWTHYDLPVTAAGYFLDRSVQAPTGQVGVVWSGGASPSPCCAAVPNLVGVPGMWGTTTASVLCSRCGLPSLARTDAVVINQLYQAGPIGHGITASFVRVQL